MGVRSGTICCFWTEATMAESLLLLESSLADLLHALAKVKDMRPGPVSERCFAVANRSFVAHPGRGSHHSGQRFGGNPDFRPASPRSSKSAGR